MRKAARPERPVELEDTSHAGVSKGGPLVHVRRSVASHRRLRLAQRLCGSLAPCRRLGKAARQTDTISTLGYSVSNTHKPPTATMDAFRLLSF